MSERHDKQRIMSVQQAEREMAALQDTKQRLEAELSATTDRIIKLAHYVEIAREFGPTSSYPEPRAATDESASKPNGASTAKAPKGGMSGRAVRECIAILRERKRRIPVRELNDLILQRGIRLGGQSPINSLSGYLSRTPGLIGDKTLGWGLEEWRDGSGAL
jgi:hypothetical protein